MTENIPLPVLIRKNIDFISKRAQEIETSDEVRDRVLDVCENISKDVLGRLGQEPSADLLERLKGLLFDFDKIIQEVEDDEQEMAVLLMTHVGDILCVLQEKNE